MHVLDQQHAGCRQIQDSYASGCSYSWLSIRKFGPMKAYRWRRRLFDLRLKKATEGGSSLEPQLRHVAGFTGLLVLPWSRAEPWSLSVKLEGFRPKKQLWLIPVGWQYPASEQTGITGPAAMTVCSSPSPMSMLTRNLKWLESSMVVYAVDSRSRSRNDRNTRVPASTKGSCKILTLEIMANFLGTSAGHSPSLFGNEEFRSLQCISQK